MEKSAKLKFYFLFLIGTLFFPIKTLFAQAQNDIIFLIDDSASVSSEAYSNIEATIKNVAIEVLECNPNNKIAVIHHSGKYLGLGVVDSRIYIESDFSNDIDVVIDFERRGGSTWQGGTHQGEMGLSDDAPQALEIIGEALDGNPDGRIVSSQTTLSHSPDRGLIIFMFTDAMRTSIDSYLVSTSSDDPFEVYNLFKTERFARFAVLRAPPANLDPVLESEAKEASAAIANVGGSYTGPIEENPNDPEWSQTTPRLFYYMEQPEFSELDPEIFSELTEELCDLSFQVMIPPVADFKVCPGDIINLNKALSQTIPSNATLSWWTGSTLEAGNLVNDPTDVNPGTYYATLSFDTGIISDPVAIEVGVYQPGESGPARENETDFDWEYPASSNPVEESFQLPGSSRGMGIEIYSLNHSFSLEVNGAIITSEDIEFGSPSEGIEPNIQFADDDDYSDEIPSISTLTGDADHPILYVQINENGEILFLASKSSGGNLVPLRLKKVVDNTLNPISFNTDVTWHQNQPNEIRFLQNQSGETKMSGKIFNLIEKENPCGSGQISILKESDHNLTYDEVGQVIEYTITIKNTGDFPLTDIVVTDPNADNDFYEEIDLLNPGETQIYTATHTITQDDIETGYVVNQAFAQTADSEEASIDPNPVDPEFTEEINCADCTLDFIVQNPGVSLEKTADRSIVFSEIGQEIDYTITVSNIGNVILYDIEVMEPLISTSPIAYIPELYPGESESFDVSYEITQADIETGYVVNQAFAETADLLEASIDPDPIDPEFTEEINCGDCTLVFIVQNPSISLEKTADRSIIYSDIGQEINYVVKVTNIGNVILYDIEVTDPLIATSAIGYISELYPGESESIEVSYEITQEDIENQYVANQAFGEGKDVNEEVIAAVSFDPSPIIPRVGQISDCETCTFVDVIGECELKIYNGVSANNDGYNDYFVIDHSFCQGKLAVKIYSRWGSLVFESSDYGVHNEVFNGEANVSGVLLNPSGKLPTGTYYYWIKYEEKEEVPVVKRGYLYLTY